MSFIFWSRHLFICWFCVMLDFGLVLTSGTFSRSFFCILLQLLGTFLASIFHRPSGVICCCFLGDLFVLKNKQSGRAAITITLRVLDQGRVLIFVLSGALIISAFPTFLRSQDKSFFLSKHASWRKKKQPTPNIPSLAPSVSLALSLRDLRPLRVRVDPWVSAEHFVSFRPAASAVTVKQGTYYRGVEK